MELNVLWVGKGANAETRLDWVKAAYGPGSRIPVKVKSLEGEPGSIARWHELVSDAEFVVADFCDDDGGVSPDVVIVATLAQYCLGKPTYLLVHPGEPLPFDWSTHGRLCCIEPGLGARTGLVGWFGGRLMQTEHGAAPSLQPRHVLVPPEVFVAMPFQGYIPPTLPHPDAFNFTRVLDAVQKAVSMVRLEPKPVVTVVGREPGGGDILDRIAEKLASAALVVADLSPDYYSRPQPNPNVLTEATMARAGYGHDKSLLLCLQRESNSREDPDVPTVWKPFVTTFYDPTSLHTSEHGSENRPLHLSEALAARIEWALTVEEAPTEDRGTSKPLPLPLPPDELAPPPVGVATTPRDDGPAIGDATLEPLGFAELEPSGTAGTGSGLPEIGQAAIRPFDD